ncbi:MAG: NAD(P)/FAD-dependent oxidoreductase [Anaerolineales bacterium]|nr:NAD(P)/FAD-dependent oxidoreductase [Anaerolineales bacterium]
MKGSKESASLGPLRNGSRVIIIGGGPGGVSCALALHKISAHLGRHLNITILENKEFATERQYNQCVGVLSPPIASLFEEQLGLAFPFHLKRDFIKGYILHAGNEQILLEDNGDPSISLRRVQFDAYMLESVKKLGIRVIQTRAVDLEFFHDHVVVYTESLPVKGDVVVGAWGMDDGSATLFHRVTGYRPPHALSAIVTKYHPGEEAMARFGSYIHAFLPRHPRIEFGGITPKGNHVTINIAGKTVDSHLMNEFLDMPNIRRVLPNFSVAGKRDPEDLLFFKGRFPCSLAKRYYGDRYVLIGDAAGLVRTFKGKGVTSAALTGIRAAEVMLNYGISELCFSYHYDRANQDIIRDLSYGKFMRSLTIFLSHLRLFDPILRAAQHNHDLQSALLDAVSAHDTYRKVLLHVLKPKPISAVLLEMAKSSLALPLKAKHFPEDAYLDKIVK